MTPDQETRLQSELAKALAQAGADKACKTPDWVLAGYLMECLRNFRWTVRQQNLWLEEEKLPKAEQQGHLP